MQLNWLDTATSKLSDGFPDRMVLLDCETTGGNATHNRVIEIGLLIIDDGNVVKRWQSFIDPRTSLPPFIQKITGIEPGMLVGAPLFSDVAEELIELLRGRVLVAHNARFDYGFLKNEFARVGIKYSTKPLCSVKFSRSLYPQFKRHGLSHIIKRFDLVIENRHRAMDDAEMIYHFFLKSSTLFSDEEIASNCKQQLKRPSLPMNLSGDEVDKLPSSAGVYYFYDGTGTLLYVGKSVNIRNRVMSHFTQDHKNPKDLKMSSKIAHVDFKTTPSDFGAQVLESHEIKSLNPLYNRRLRKIKKMYQFVSHYNSGGYQCLSVQAVDVTAGVQNSSVGLFRSLRQANKKLESIAETFSLCHKLLCLESPSNSSRCGACFRTQLGKCFGACNGNESAELYNQRIKNALEEYQLQIWPFPGPILIEERNLDDPDLTGLHIIDQWRYVTKIHSSDDLSELGFRVVNSLVNALDKKSESFPDVSFDLDIYFILVRFLVDEKQMAMNNIKIWQLLYQAKEEY
jgi:DNA polymerase-3 subunit epsilon